MDVLLLSADDVRSLLDHAALLDALAEEFVALSADRLVAPKRSEVSVPDAGFLLTMPAWRDGREMSVKLVTVFSGNAEHGLPGHQALICLFDPQTGTPSAIMDGTHLTAMRTAGAAALSARLVARPESRELAIIGAGAQAQAHLAIFPHVRDFTEIRIASRTTAHAERLAATHPLARAMPDAEAAIRGADVVCLCTDSATAVLRADWLAPGAHVTSVGYRPPGSELDPAIIARGRLFVETRHAFEPPPTGCAELAGIDSSRGAELGQVLSGQAPGRTSADELTVYKSMGHACEDMAAASLVYRRARAAQAGRMVTL